MLASWAIAVHLLTNTIDRRLDDQLDHATAILAEGEFPFSPELIGRLDRLIEARIILLDASRSVALSTTDGPANDALDDFAAVTESIDAAMLYTAKAGNSTWRISVRPLTLARDARFAYVAAVASLDESRKAARDAAMLLGAAMLIVMLVLAWVGNYFTDLTKQARLAGLGDLSARIAHEIRNPLTAIKMQLQLLEKKVAPDDVQRVGKVLSEIRRMEMIVESALTLGAPLSLHKQTFRLDALIDDLADLLRPALQHRSINLETDTAFRGQIDSDPDRLRQALINLVNNAADALQDGGTIEIGCSVDQDVASISIEDSGPGLPDRAADEESDKPFSLGLGLSICREIVDLHGGELTSDSSPTLGGARFTIRLPVPIIDSNENSG